MGILARLDRAVRITLSRVAIVPLLALAMVAGIGAAGATDEPAEMVIGVLAFRGDDAAIMRWSATARYLSERIGDYRFRIVPLTLDGMSNQVETDRLDFILTNTGNYVMLENAYGISRLATLKVRHLGEEFTQFGAVVFTRAGHPELSRLEDLADHSLMAVSKNAFGGFQMAWRELKEIGIDPFSDLSQLRFIGFPQDDIVLSVVEGRVDAGTVRSGTLERMAADGLISIDDIRVLGARRSDTFPFVHSTRLYPEWPFAKARHTPEELAQRVAVALLQMESDSEAASLAFAAGWTIPLDYGPVHELFRELEIGPYAYLSRPDPTLIWREYRGWILFILLLLALLLVLLYLILRAEINRREQQHQVQLAHIARVNSTGEMAAGIAHELNQPLTAILNYSSGCLRLLQKDRPDYRELEAAIVQVGNDARRAAGIIKSLREFIKRDQFRQRDIELRDCIEPALELLRSRLRQQQIQVEVSDEMDGARIHADRIQIEQVLVNLLQNAIDALQADGGNRADKRIYIRIDDADPGYVAVAVTDNGPALSQQVVDHLFDPFFTTKPEGMGMGLAISRSIIESHGGTIEYLLDDQQLPTIRFILPIV